MTSSSPSPKRCGFVALIGAPNAGKSTLMNRIVGSKLSIVTPKAQTTRSRVTGVVVKDNAQIICVDVPGVFNAKQRFEQAMVACAWAGADEADVIAFLFDVTKKPSEETEAALARIGSGKAPRILVLNKVDAIKDKSHLLPLIEWFNARLEFPSIILISALSGDGVNDLLQRIISFLPESEWLYDEDYLTDVPKRLLAAEMTREQCFFKLREELPYSLMVETETYEERADGSIKIHQVITVQNERQKTIVLGKSGAMLKLIGENARKQIERSWQCRCHLFLFVRVREDWKDKPEHYSTLGLSF
jgi:GTP-binding protein Era